MKRYLFSCTLGLSMAVRFSGMAALPEVWQVRSAPASNQLNGITYGNGLFVAVGREATVLTSSNGADWIRRVSGTDELYSATHGNGRYVVGGEMSRLLVSSNDGIGWTNAMSTSGVQHIFGITYGGGLFVAVGVGVSGTGYILTSSNALDWHSQNAPATNALFAVAPAMTPQGIGWPSNLFVAVGEHGTIVTSPNGTDWTLRESGSEIVFRAVAFHRSAFIVAGDQGTVLSSTDGISWSAVAPISFDVRGLTSDGELILAVGNDHDSGRLHESTDGLAWPDSSVEFLRPLNAIAYGRGSFVAVGQDGLIVQSEVSMAAATNSWIKSTSGSWEEQFSWSLGELPGPEQAAVALRNSGFKALAIGASTTTDYAYSLSIPHLTVDAPVGSANLLLLNHAGLEVPLNVTSDLVVGPNGSLLSYYSALRGGSVYLSGPATLAEGSTALFRSIGIGVDAPATLTVSNSSLSADLLVVGQNTNGTVIQTGGTNQTQNIAVPSSALSSGEYLLSGGVLTSSNLSLGIASLGPDGNGDFVQSGGTHTNASMTLAGIVRNSSGGPPYGVYTLNAGLLISDTAYLHGGDFLQNGGTNYTGEILLDEAGSFVLRGGELVSSNITINTSGCAPSIFAQSNANHWVQNRLKLDDNVSYDLWGGRLTASNIDIGPSAQFRLLGGSISNTGMFIIRGGVFRASGSPHQLGQLQVLGLPPSCPGWPFSSALDLRYDFANAGTVLHFRDSRHVSWSGSSNLLILNWSNSANGASPHHIFVGTNAQGLTASQLSQITFVNPAGWLAGSYPAQILSTGEIVPALPPITFSRTTGRLILSWTGNEELFSATNVAGPYLRINGASNPYTNSFLDPQRYFQLRAIP